jgi:hypothetical protein
MIRPDNMAASQRPQFTIGLLWPRRSSHIVRANQHAQRAPGPYIDAIGEV